MSAKSVTTVAVCLFVNISVVAWLCAYEGEEVTVAGCIAAGEVK